MGDARQLGSLALATALALAAGALLATPVQAEGAFRADPLPQQLLPRVDAPPPALSKRPVWAEDERSPRAGGRIDYYSREDRQADALASRRKGRFRYLKYDFDMQLGDEQVEVRLRAPSKRAVKKRLLSAGFEIRF